jgi:hypothetical protein
MMPAMNRTAPRHAIDIATEFLAVASLSGAVSFALWMLAPTGRGGADLALAAVAGALAGMLAFVTLTRVDRRPPIGIGIGFEPLPLGTTMAPDEQDDDGVVEMDEDADVLVLDQPLRPIDRDSRVIQLFAGERAPRSEPSADLPGAGEMVARIEHFLRPDRAPEAALADDANAALHAALADIRRSLRQG